MAEVSKEFFEFVREIGETRSREEEEVIVRREVARLKAACAHPDPAVASNARKGREMLLRMIYCEMLGYEVPFAYMSALSSAQHHKVSNRRTGHLALSLFLGEEHELSIMNTNSVRKGLESANFAEVCTSLTALLHLASPKTIPVFLPVVRPLLNHKKAIVRQKAVAAVHAMIMKDSSAIPDGNKLMRSALCDREPAVMVAAICAVSDLVAADAALWHDVVPSICSILAQVIDRRLPKSYDYAGIPAPWVQLHLLDILGALGRDNKRCSEQMYPVLGQAFRAAAQVPGSNPMVLYGCIRTATKIYPKRELLAAAGTHITALLRSGDANLRYLGLRSLGELVRHDPSFAAQHQMTVVECLESDDETLRRETLELLYRMVNAKNVGAITARLLAHLGSPAADSFMREELVARVTQIAERYAPSHEWYLETVASVLENGGDCARADLALPLLRLLAPGGAGDAPFRRFAADWFSRKAAATVDAAGRDAARVPETLMQVAAWVLGEYGHLAACGTEKVILQLCSLLDLNLETASTRGYIVSALVKLCVRLGRAPPSQVASALNKFKNSAHTDIQQRCYECSALLDDCAVSRRVLPCDADLPAAPAKIDASLPFLDAHVQKALAAGAKPYVPRSLRRAASPKEAAAQQGHGDELNIAAYPAPSHPYAAVAPGFLQPAPAVLRPAAAPASSAASAVAAAAAAGAPSKAKAAGGEAQAGLHLGAMPAKKVVWTQQGYSMPSPAAAPAPAPAPPAPAPLPAAAAPAPAPAQQAATPRASRAPAPAARVVDERKARIARDLFGGGEEDEPSVASIVLREDEPRKQSAGSGTPTMDLLLDLGAGSGDAGAARQPQQSSTPASPPPLPASQLIADLLGIDVKPQAPAPSSSAASVLEALPAPVAAPGAQSMHSLLFGEPQLPAAAQLPAQQPQILSCVEPTAALVCQSGPVALYSARLYKAGQLGVALLLGSASACEVARTVSVAVDANAAVQIELACPPNVTADRTSASVARVPARLSVIAVLKLRIGGFEGARAGLAITGRFTESGSAQPQSLRVPLTVFDFMRPRKMTTEEVGAQWPLHPHERSVDLRYARSGGGITALAADIKAKFRMHCVEVIGSEAIFCGAVVGATKEMLCLVHARAWDDGVNVSVLARTQSVALTAWICEAGADAL
eukprot:m51a1_g8782 Adaptor protein complex 4 (AP-4), epsilon subunit (1162) ;mRNA; f:191718-196355